MENQTQENLKEIEKHLKALVRLKALQMTKKMADQGAFEKNGVQSVDKANARRDQFIEWAYNQKKKEE